MIPEILVAITFVLGGRQDIRERSVSDWVWLPAAAGIAIAFLFREFDLAFLLIMVIIGLLALIFARLGAVGMADGIAFFIVMLEPNAFDLIPILASISAVAMVHIGYIYYKGLQKRRVIPIAQFNSEPFWIPRAAILEGGKRILLSINVNRSREEVDKILKQTTQVEVQYGVPTVAYIAGGYLVFLVFLAFFQPHTFFLLP